MMTITDRTEEVELKVIIQEMKVIVPEMMDIMIEGADSVIPDLIMKEEVMTTKSMATRKRIMIITAAAKNMIKTNQLKI